MLRLGVRSALGLAKGGMAEASVLPAFLCPRLIHVDVDRIRHRKRSVTTRQEHSVASTSKLSTSLPDEVELLLQDQEEEDAWKMDVKAPSGFDTLMPSDLVGVRIKRAKGKLKTSKVLDELTLMQEFIEDILRREQIFTSKAESALLLHEGVLLLTAQRMQEDEAVQHLVQAIAPKLAFIYLKYGRPTKSIGIAREITSTWTAESEERHRTTWKQVVSLAYSMGMYSEAYQVSHMLTKYSRFVDNWMSLARLQSLLRMAESGQSNSLLDSIDTLWEAYERKGLSVPETPLLLLLDSQARRGEKDKMAQTIKAMKRHDIHITSDVWRALFGFSLRGKGRKEELKMVVDSLEDASSLVEELIDFYVADTDLRGCLRVLKMFGMPCGAQRSDSPLLTPTLDIYSPLIIMMSTQGLFQHAVRFLNQCIKNKYRGNYGRLFLELAIALNDADKSEEAVYIGVNLLDSPLRHKYPVPPSIPPLVNKEATTRPSTLFYSALLSSLSNYANTNAIVPAARAILLEMFTHGFEVDKHIRKALTCIVARLGRQGRVRNLVAYAEALFSIAIPDGAKSLLAVPDSSDSEAIDRRRWMLALEREGVADQLTLVVWEKTRLERSKHTPQRRRTLASMVVNSIPFDELGRTRIATAEGTSQEASQGADASEAAKDSVEEVKQTPSEAPNEMAKQAFSRKASEVDYRIPFRDLELDVDLSPAAYALRLRIFAVIRLEFGNALRIYQSMIGNGVLPSIHHIEPLVEGLVLAGRLKDAHMIKDRAKQEFPDSTIPLNIYTSLVRGCGQKQDWQGILSIANEMRKDGMKIDRFIQIAFRRAKRILRHEAKMAGKRGDGLAQDQLSKIAQQPLPKRVNVKPMSVVEATMMFNDYHRTGQSLIAQQQLAKALDEGLQADAHLRDILARCDNWLRKKIESMEGLKHKHRQRSVLEECLRLCRINRERMKMSREQEAAHVMMQLQAERQRGAMLKLLKEVVGSRRLWNEAQRIKDTL